MAFDRKIHPSKNNHKQTKKKMNGYIIALQDGTEISAVPGDSGFEMTIGEIVVSISEGRATVSSAIGATKCSLAVTSITPAEIDVPEERNKAAIEQEVAGLLRRCIICQGRYYCITNGCAGTPCGWICG